MGSPSWLIDEIQQWDMMLLCSQLVKMSEGGFERRCDEGELSLAAYSVQKRRRILSPANTIGDAYRKKILELIIGDREPADFLV
jgi:hypothetical protein